MYLVVGGRSHFLLKAPLIKTKDRGTIEILAFVSEMDIREAGLHWESNIKDKIRECKMMQIEDAKYKEIV